MTRSYFVFLLFGISIILNAAESQIYESQPNVIFKNKALIENEKEISLQVTFNTAVLYLEKEEYQKAIRLFKKTAKLLKIPSFLNIGIAHYKLGSINNAYLYLKKIYDIELLAKQDMYSYISASYYLYYITQDRKYITKIIEVVSNSEQKKLSEPVKRLLVDTYILLKEYKKAVKVLRSKETINNLKLALLYIKTKEYGKSGIYLQKAYLETKNDDKINQILWLQIFRDLKANDIVKIIDKIAIIQDRRKIFDANQRNPITIHFNKDKYSAQEYFNRVTKFSTERKIDFIFYFAPFIFIDQKEISNDIALGLVLKNKENIDSLDLMIDYNREFISLVKEDPIIRSNKLQVKIDKKFDTKAYEYYNLGLSYAQIFDFKRAYKNFYKAYNLNHANKLYSSMTLISALRADITIDEKIEKRIKDNLLSNKGPYKYLSKYIHKLIFLNTLKLNRLTLDRTTRKSIFFRALVFIEEADKTYIDIKQPLLSVDSKDPLVFLLRSVAKQENETEYDYISRLQDDLPKRYNDYFLKGPLIITKYYIELLKGLGIFDSVDFNIKGEDSPTYLRTKAYVQLYDGFALKSIEILEKLQKKYNLNDKETYNLLTASLLAANDYSNASANLGMMQFEFKDKDAKFLNGIQLLQSLKLNGASQSFKYKYKGDLDFQLEGFDRLLESL